MDKMHYEITIKGRVQGVWFRKFTKNLADDLGVKGTVSNQPDDNVFAQAEGNTAILSQFLEGLKRGSQLSKVTEVSFVVREIVGFENFEIIR